MLIKPYTILNDEQRDPFTLRHIGTVVNNNDPEKRKRLQIHIDPWDYLEDEALPWVKQEGDGAIGCSPSESSHHIPEIGAEVTVYFKNNDPNDPVYTGVETTEANRCTLFDEGYPNSYGNKDSVGNYEVVNKDSKTTVRQYASGTTVRAEANGEMCIETKEGNYIKIDGDGIITLYGPKVRILPDDEIEMRATKIHIQATNKLELWGSAVEIKGGTGVDITGGTVGINAPADVNIKAKDVNCTSLRVAKGLKSGQVTDIPSGKLYDVEDGIVMGTGG